MQRFYHQQNQLRDKQERRNKEAEGIDPRLSHIPKYQSPYTSSPPAQQYQHIPAHPTANRQSNLNQPIYSRSPPIEIDPTPTPHNPFANLTQIPIAHHPHQLYQFRHASEPRVTNGLPTNNSPKHQFFYSASPGAYRRSVHPPSHQESIDSSQLPPLHPVYSRSPPDRRVYPTVGHPVAKSINQTSYDEDANQINTDREPMPEKGGERLREDQGNNHIIE